MDRDTINVSIKDSSTIINGKNERIILIQDKTRNEYKPWYENVFFTSLIIPILVAAIVAIILRRIDGKKYNQEVAKLKEETNQLKRSFEPHVLSILQETQKEILALKIEGLKKLVLMSKNYYAFDNPYSNGEPIFQDEYEYYVNILSNFGNVGYREFQKFVADYEYLYPQLVRIEFEGIKSLFNELYDSNKRNTSLSKIDLSDRDEVALKQLNGYFDRAIEAIRKDLHLDNTFINDFLNHNRASRND